VSSHSQHARPLPHPQSRLPFPATPEPEEATVEITLPAIVAENFAADFDEGDDLEPEE
jgi:hypothetical protein